MLSNIPQGFIPTAWATAANIGGTGTTIVESGAMTIPMPPVNFIDWIIEIEFTHNKAAGTGYTWTWVKFSHLFNALTATDSLAVPVLYTPYYWTDTAITRAGVDSIKVRPSIMNGRYSAGNGSQYVYIRSKGSAADTEWTATNMRARILYKPL